MAPRRRITWLMEAECAKAGDPSDGLSSPHAAACAVVPGHGPGAARPGGAAVHLGVGADGGRRLVGRLACAAPAGGHRQQVRAARAARGRAGGLPPVADGSLCSRATCAPASLARGVPWQSGPHSTPTAGPNSARLRSRRPRRLKSENPAIARLLDQPQLAANELAMRLFYFYNATDKPLLSDQQLAALADGAADSQAAGQQGDDWVAPVSAELKHALNRNRDFACLAYDFNTGRGPQRAGWTPAARPSLAGCPPCPHLPSPDGCNRHQPPGAARALPARPVSAARRAPPARAACRRDAEGAAVSARLHAAVRLVHRRPGQRLPGLLPVHQARRNGWAHAARRSTAWRETGRMRTTAAQQRRRCIRLRACRPTTCSLTAV